MRVPFTQVDAFADRAFGGNPAAVMPLPYWPDDDTLRAIAAENNLSETAFLVAEDGGDADHVLRWFTPTAEVDLCGHATLASGHVVLSGDPTLARVRFATRAAGMLTVERAEAGYRMALPAWGATPGEMPGVVAALGVDPVETLWHPRGYAVVVVADEAAVRAAAPDFRALAAEGPILAIVTARGTATDIVSRVFVPAYGIDEDPVTGAAHAAIVPWWSAQLGRASFTAHQASARGGTMRCTHADDRVWLEARCVTVIEGVFTF